MSKDENKDVTNIKPHQNCLENWDRHGRSCTLKTHLQDSDIAITFFDSVSAPCVFNSDAFEQVLLNLIKNPNITSSHLFRADIFYDSTTDASYAPAGAVQRDGSLTAFAKHMKAELRPLTLDIDGYELTRTIVRQLMPRNPNLDRPLVQTCHFFSGAAEAELGRTMVVYVPHVVREEDVPFYHPAVRLLAFEHETRANGSSHGEPDVAAEERMAEAVNRISIKIAPFAKCEGKQVTAENQQPYVFSMRMNSTVSNLLRTIHKHGTSRHLQNYEKRVHHDQIIPQKAFQDTYTRLKLNHAKGLIENWRENTDPGKHVFEDLGIAAFLVELWAKWYPKNGPGEFPGFVDIGCGNGLLVNLLLKEGYKGRGLDARERKSWSGYDDSVRRQLRESVLVPSVLNVVHMGDFSNPQNETGLSSTGLHSLCFDGLLPEGTFIVSNHADELTTWTPLLAYLSRCSFICIPCCSHDLSGARTRFSSKLGKDISSKSLSKSALVEGDSQPKSGQLVSAPSHQPTKPPSAYSTLCGYVTYLAEELGFTVEKEMLRIPSTRNAALVGRLPVSTPDDIQSLHVREQKIRLIVERELEQPIFEVAQRWRAAIERIAHAKGCGH